MLLPIQVLVDPTVGLPMHAAIHYTSFNFLGLVDLHIVLYILPQVEHTGPRLAALVHLQGHKTCESPEGGGYQYMYVYLLHGKPWSMTMLYILTCI